MTHTRIKIGYDLSDIVKHGIKTPIMVSMYIHLIVVGASGSGKSTALIYWIYKVLTFDVEWYICDYKLSNEFIGLGTHLAQGDDCVSLIRSFYEDFLNTPEGGDGRIKILLIDEVAGLLMHLSINKETKPIADEVRTIMSEILMLGRSRKCFLWLSMQRYSASVFPSASGAGDNFMVSVGLGRLTIDSRRGLFGGEHFDGEEDLRFGQGKGIILTDCEPLRSIVIPNVDKQNLRSRILCHTK